MYYLLHQRLNSRLKERFMVFESRLLDDFNDVVEDFFLYLREGKDGKSHEPYQSIRRIRKKEAFETWMLSTFRNYLSVRADKEGQMACVVDKIDVDKLISSRDNLLTYQPINVSIDKERKLAIASHLIAFAHQVFYPRSRFIFLRSLLTMLNKQQALPNEEMAQALGMTEISYRVTSHRLKCRLAKYRTLLLQGKTLALDEAHRQMAACIKDDFAHLYPTLMRYYGQALETLNHADAIKQLLQEYYEATGQMLHEPDTAYSLAPSISAFWNRLDRFLLV